MYIFLYRIYIYIFLFSFLVCLIDLLDKSKFLSHRFYYNKMMLYIYFYNVISKYSLRIECNEFKSINYMRHFHTFSLKWFIENNIIYPKIKITSEKNSIFVIPKNNCKVNEYQETTGNPVDITEHSANLIYSYLQYHVRSGYGFFGSNINCFRLKLTDIPATGRAIGSAQRSAIFLIDCGDIDFYYFTF